MAKTIPNSVNGEKKIAKKRSKNPGVRVIGGRIYDSENGRTCHQCRQKTRDFAALCKTVKKEKLCTLTFCHKCLLNRYGEKAQEVEKLDDWSCPRCRGICNCSFCMKQKGQQPTGILAHTAKATGFNSVQELLQIKGSEVLEIHNLIKNANTTPNKSSLSNKVLSGMKRKYNNENQSMEQNEAVSVDKLEERKKKILKKVQNEAILVDKMAKKEKEGLKKVKLLECGESQVLTANQAKPSKLENHSKNDHASVTEASSVDKMAKKEKKRLKKAKILARGESQVPTVNQSKPSKLENHSKNSHAGDSSQTEAIFDDKMAKKEGGLKKVTILECGESQVPTANQAKPSKVVNHSKNSHASDTCQTEAISVDKMTKKENTGSKKAKILECGESQVPTAIQAKPSKLENISKTDHANDTSLTQKIAAITEVFKSRIDLKHNIECKQENITLPLAKPLLDFAEYQLPAQDNGAALQFLEFCNSFSQILDLKKGQPECVLRDIAGRPRRLRGRHSAFAQFCIKLLDLIYDNVKKNGDAWLQALKTCIEESECKLKELAMDSIRNSYGLENLQPSQKLLVLNFLCDEVLLTEQCRKFIDEAEAKFVEKRKETKQKFADAKKKGKLIKQKAKDEIAKVMLSGQDGRLLSVSELDEILSKLRIEADRVHAEISSSLELNTQKNQRSDAVRTEPVIQESNGKIFWKLSSYGNGSKTILQEIDNWDSVTLQDKWFVFDDDEEKVEKYVHSVRSLSLKRCRTEEGNDCSKSGCQASKTEVAEEIEVCDDKVAD